MSMKIAIKAAKANTIYKLPPMAAVIMDGKKIVSICLNSYKTHPLQARFCKHEKATSIHAEIAAIANAKCDVRGMTMYIAKVRRSGKLNCGKPCEGCQRALIAFGLKKVIWTEDDSKTSSL